MDAQLKPQIRYIRVAPKERAQAPQEEAQANFGNLPSPKLIEVPLSYCFISMKRLSPESVDNSEEEIESAISYCDCSWFSIKLVNF